MNKADFLSQVKKKLELWSGDVVTLIKDADNNGICDYSLQISQDRQLDFDFEFLAWLSDVFESRKINIGNRWGSEGCETCGYGARHEVTVFILKSPKLID